MTKKIKRSLSQIGGPIRREGDAAALAAAWTAASHEDPDSLTHGFHPWPARMHPAIARVIFETSGVESVVDPFCGAGTTLVEARVAGVEALGVDLSPLAIRLARVKAGFPSPESREAFLASARAVAARSEARVRGRVPILVKLPRPELAHWDVHVLKELGGLREEIRGLERFEERQALAMVFSSILTKVGKQRSETQEDATDRKIRKGLTTELFLRKANELAERWQALAEVTKGPAPDLVEGDARQLARIAGSRRFDLVLTSPPYGGTYDYAAHHARRMAWLELDDSKLRRLELGARRRMGFDDAKAHWDQEVSEMLRALASVLRPDGGSIVLVMGDAVVADERVTVPAQLARLAPEVGLRVAGVASQPRHAGREEHIVWLRRSGT